MLFKMINYFWAYYINNIDSWTIKEKVLKNYTVKSTEKVIIHYLGDV